MATWGGGGGIVHVGGVRALILLLEPLPPKCVCRPWSVPSTRITVSGVPPFPPNIPVENELRRFGKPASGLRAVSLGCKDPNLKHVRSLRRQVFMLLDSPTQTLEVSWAPTHSLPFSLCLSARPRPLDRSSPAQ